METSTMRETIEAITVAIQPLAEALGETGKYVFQLAVRQVYVPAIQIGIAAIFVVGAWVVYGVVIKKYVSRESLSEDESAQMAVVFTAAILVVVSLFVIIRFIAIIPQVLVNPEWQAIVNIKEMLIGQ